MKPGIERIEKTLAPFIVIQDGRKCMPKENIDAAVEKITNKFSDCFCEVSPHATFPVFTFKVSRAKQIYFEAVVICW